jgi:hypothetical protein
MAGTLTQYQNYKTANYAKEEYHGKHRLHHPLITLHSNRMGKVIGDIQNIPIVLASSTENHESTQQEREKLVGGKEIP